MPKSLAMIDDGAGQGYSCCNGEAHPVRGTLATSQKRTKILWGTLEEKIQ
jgi:hypothetical protein